jgi:hypothetical protein
MSAKPKPLPEAEAAVDIDALMRKHLKRKVDVSFWGGISVDPDTIRIRKESAEISLDRLEAFTRKLKTATP